MQHLSNQTTVGGLARSKHARRAGLDGARCARRVEPHETRASNFRQKSGGGIRDKSAIDPDRYGVEMMCGIEAENNGGER